MFEPVKRDYMDWVSLKLEDPATIGLFENQWNDFDNLTDETKLLHNTKRKTQPWKTGLKIDYRPADTFQLFPPGTGCAGVAAPCLATTNLPAPMPPTPTPGRKRSSSAWCVTAWKTARLPKPSCAMRSHRGICARMRWN